jgi:SNF2 family DNA or RNA helicase
MKLMQHQQEALDFLADKRSAGVFFEMGLGKTVVTLEHLSRLPRSALPALIVCPLSVVSVWEKEVDKFGYDFRVQKLTGTNAQRLEKLSKAADIYVINYEGMRLLRAELEKKNFQTVILDESHRIKERGSQQTQAALSLAANATYRLALTGTPVTKSPEDIWTQMHFIQPGSLENFWAFRAKHIDFKNIMVRMPGGLKSVRKAFRFKNLNQLEERVHTHCIRRTKAECLDLPDKIYKTLYCELGASQAKAYHEVKHSLATEIENNLVTMTSAASAIQKMQQICQGFIYNEAKDGIWFKENGKLGILKDLLQDIGEDKAIVFGWYKADVELLKAELSKTHTVFFYDGNADKRGEIVDAFQKHEGQAIFLAQIETAKEGITLTSAGHVIYYGNSWSYGTRMQSEDRAHRVGQNRNVIYYDLVCSGCVDEKVLQVLRDKGMMADAVLGDSIRMANLILE